MAKKKATKYVCSNCGAEFDRWYGKCTECSAWNSLNEEISISEKPSRGLGINSENNLRHKPISIKEILKEEDGKRYSTGYDEFDNVLGGGIVKGSVNLISGDPGIGKSTLLLQTVNNVAKNYGKVLYVSGEESASQIKLRADRINSVSENIFLVSETNMDIIEVYIADLKPDLVIIDSIQCMYKENLESAPGTISQIRECTGSFMRLAKGESRTAFFIVCHVTKEGNIGGPKALEHMVDTVLYFEGEQSSSFRILRGYKNRFGSTNEIGIFEMRNEGLAEVINSSEIFLTTRDYDVSGSTITCIMEGTRPMLLEVQSLASQTFAQGAPPRRLGSGIDYNRLNIIVAVLEKQAKQNLFGYDIFVNIAGGIKINEPSADLAIAMAIISSKKSKTINNKTIFLGELSLTGEVRPVPNIEKRVREAIKLGYKKIVLPHFNIKDLKDNINIKKNQVEIIEVRDIASAVSLL
jgi:DNA repair protein RadA/Sms